MGNNNYGVFYNLRLKTWSIRETGITAIGKIKLIKDAIINNIHTQMNDPSNNVIIDSALYLGAKTYTIAGDKDGYLYMVDGYTDLRYVDGSGEPEGYEGYVITKTHHMEEPGKIKRLMRI
jgi:hypothetical protein